jgi:hypothetical protein
LRGCLAHPAAQQFYFFLHARYFQVAIAIMSMPATCPAAAPATEALVKQVIDEFGGPGACTLPEDKEVFSHHEAAFERVQRYAFANGFVIVESQVCTHDPGGRLSELG